MVVEKPTRRRQSVAANTAPTVKEVAELAGVSTATVSRALSGAPSVSKRLITRVREAAQQLNYQPNQIARGLRTRGSRTIGVLVPDIENPFFTSVVRGIEGVLQTAGYSLLLADFNEDPSQEHTLLSALRAEGVAGILFAASHTPSPEYHALLQAGLPMVAISRLPESLRLDLVTVANREGAREAAEHLIGLGHRRVGLIAGPVTISTARERQEGFEEGFLRAGLPVPRDLIVYADFRQAGGHSAMKALLARKKPPTAVFAASNLMTLGALQAIYEHGMEIPGDISVLGFDDMAWASSLRPPLTVVAQPARDVGTAATSLLFERIQDPGRPVRHVVLQTQLVVRASCSAVPIASTV